jgi:hypothetical protein
VVETEMFRAGSSVDAYRAHDHDHVVAWFGRHWEPLEPLVDDPDYDHIRFATFDGDQLTFRFRVIAVAAGETIRLTEFAVIE